MKNVREFLKEQIQNISTQFPNLTIELGYNSGIGSYIVKIKPTAEFESNNDLDLAWGKVYDDLYEQFPEEDIAFAPMDSPLKITETIEVYYSSEKWLFEANLKFDFPNRFESMISTYNKLNNMIFQQIQVNKLPESKDLLCFINPKLPISEELVLLNTQYAMAA